MTQLDETQKEAIQTLAQISATRAEEGGTHVCPETEQRERKRITRLVESGLLDHEDEPDLWFENLQPASKLFFAILIGFFLLGIGYGLIGIVIAVVNV